MRLSLGRVVSAQFYNAVCPVIVFTCKGRGEVAQFFSRTLGFSFGFCPGRCEEGIHLDIWVELDARVHTLSPFKQKSTAAPVRARRGPVPSFRMALADGLEQLACQTGAGAGSEGRKNELRMGYCKVRGAALSVVAGGAVPV